MSEREAKAPDLTSVVPLATGRPEVADTGVLAADPHACFACGDLNEIGLHLKFRPFPGGAWTEFAVPGQYQGWEGVAHGGIVSTILDEAMSWAMTDLDFWAMTARLNVTFRRPVMVGRTIRAEGRIVEKRRRIVVAAARILDIETGDELASAEATYVAVSPAQEALLRERYGDIAARRRAIMTAIGEPPAPAMERSRERE